MQEAASRLSRYVFVLMVFDARVCSAQERELLKVLQKQPYLLKDLPVDVFPIYHIEW